MNRRFVLQGRLRVKVLHKRTCVYIVSGTSMGYYIQTRPPMWKLAHGHVSEVKNGAQTHVFRVNTSHNLLRLNTTKYLSLLLT